MLICGWSEIRNSRRSNREECQDAREDDDPAENQICRKEKDHRNLVSVPPPQK